MGNNTESASTTQAAERSNSANGKMEREPSGLMRKNITELHNEKMTIILKYYNKYKCL